MNLPISGTVPLRAIAWVALLPWLPLEAIAAAPVVCRVQATTADADWARQLRESLEVERRKAALVLDWVEVAGIEDCPAPPDTPVLVVNLLDDARVQLGQPPTPSFPIDLDEVPVPDRAGIVARGIVRFLAVPALSQRAGVLEGFVPPPRAAQAPAAVVNSRVRSPGGMSGYLQVGGAGAWQVGPSTGAGLAELEAGATFFRERLWAGVRAGWEPPRPGTGLTDARSQAVPVVAMVRGSFPVGPVSLRAGIGAGLEWRRTTLSPREYGLPLVVASLGLVLDGEVEVVVRLGRWFRLSAGPAVRGYPAPTDVHWNGDMAYRAPRLSIGGVLRVGAVFGGGNP
jgi:hypothetical protein